MDSSGNPHWLVLVLVLVLQSGPHWLGLGLWCWGWGWGTAAAGSCRSEGRLQKEGCRMGSSQHRNATQC